MVSLNLKLVIPSPVTIQTSPAGLSFTMDGGAAQTAPQTLNLPQGSHTMSVVPTQAGATGTQYVFTSWSDGGAASHNITVDSSTATYTATFSVQYLLTTAVFPSGAGTVIASPSSSGYYNAGTNVQLTASANTGYQFSNWSGDLSGSTNPQSIAMNAVHSVSTNFSVPLVATPTFSPEGGSYVGSQFVTISDATPGATIFYLTYAQV